jgi:hypothetical protein
MDLIADLRTLVEEGKISSVVENLAIFEASRKIY